jgi:hypothetical protein
MTTRKIKALPHRKHFIRTIFKNILLCCLILIASLSVGVIGYHNYFDLGWVDSLYNASMILAGMGPVDSASNNGGKIFASIYAIYSGVAFLTSVAVIFLPVLHRFLHKFKIDVEE